MAAILRAAEVGATAAEIDVRTSRDGRLFLLHDATLDRTTNGKGPASDLTLQELQSLDAGSHFNPECGSARIPSLAEAAQAARGRIGLLLDLKEQGDGYDRQVAGKGLPGRKQWASGRASSSGRGVVQGIQDGPGVGGTSAMVVVPGSDRSGQGGRDTGIPTGIHNLSRGA